MPEPRTSRPAPRARPVADAPLPTGGEQIEAIARRWALELLAERPLADAAELPLDEIAARAPGLCEQILNALGSERELDRLLGRPVPGDRRAHHDFAADLLACAGAGEGHDALLAAEALRSALWQELQEELRGSDAPLAGPLADRLAHLCSALLGEALQALPEAPGPDEESATEGEQSPSVTRSGGGRIVILDERLSAVAEQPEPAASSPESVPRAPATLPEPSPRIEIHDRRREEGPGAWIGSIGAQLERFEQDGRPFAVLLLELAGTPADSDGQSLGAIERSIREELDRAPGATLTSERPGRWWAVLPDTDRTGARSLAGSLEGAVRGQAERLGGSATVLHGMAVCPEDGRTASALAAHADVGLYASRWEARSGVARGRPA
jgi:hypothetical protein